MTWLITGGAGYIGAHVLRAMTEDGQQAVATCRPAMPPASAMRRWCRAASSTGRSSTRL
jgi:uncharacterized protein YbjT (DUF2867 family)